MTKYKSKLSLPFKIFIALILGVLFGIAMTGDSQIAVTYIKPFGDGFLALIKMVVIPLVFCSLLVGVGSLNNIKQLGRFGIKTIIFFMFTTSIAVMLGLVLSNLLNVSSGFSMNTNIINKSDVIMKKAPTIAETIINIIPSNPIKSLVDGNMLQIITFAIILGIALLESGEKGREVFGIFETIANAMYKIISWIMKLAPIGVFALIVPAIATNGAVVIGSLLKLILVAYFVSIAHIILVYGLSVKLIGKINPLRFFKTVIPAMLTAFSTSSSSGTLPVSMNVAEKLGVSKTVTSFVLPLGSTINMDGTAIYQGVCAIFIAKVFGVDLTVGQQLVIILSATLASIGTAGVPGAGMIMLAMVLQSVGLPVEGIALVAGIDRPLDMMRTVVNVTGDITCSVIVANTENKINHKN
ncbi:dicarboxylate/amino acid:cation symporter [Helcococcus ovis]|uniref:Dicarboxylate/amino acid:cation symporter n=1 Tax=Helcococcus ovis TaxID=72026 RepID=A0A4R9C393_9FIRM|nr:dicarboxylate/amino acid:cation symporter [Helcococcus ovis]TFF66212.1 dicarboxylate/amino acid:cation symporter [Helcococcus ovis]TFF67309.1 dicarboxylate/amino acid:cation symporter [Helcococcus ovis]